MPPGALFTRCGHALFGDGMSWKLQFGLALGVKTDSIDAFAKGEKRIPPGLWLDIAGLIQDREIALAGLKVAVDQCINPEPSPAPGGFQTSASSAPRRR